MKLERLPYDPHSVMAFYEEGLTALGAISERTWHDRLEVLAEGRAAALWAAPDGIYAGELHFAAADATTAREASRQVFPGSPLTFALSEALRPSAVLLERVVMNWDTSSAPPQPAVLEKHWHAQFATTGRLSLAEPLKPDWHFSIVALVRVEVQAIDQHWSLHRLALALPSGKVDDHLARELHFGTLGADNVEGLTWPAVSAELCGKLICEGIQGEIPGELAAIGARQQASLQREIERVDGYFENYAAELAKRSKRSASQNVRMKAGERLAAAKSEHARRRADQIARHEIRVVPHVDALLLVAERAWAASLRIDHGREAEFVRAQYVRRSRRWYR